jgi:hypothetical protein
MDPDGQTANIHIIQIINKLTIKRVTTVTR